MQIFRLLLLVIACGTAPAIGPVPLRDAAGVSAHLGNEVVAEGVISVETLAPIGWAELILVLPDGTRLHVHGHGTDQPSTYDKAPVRAYGTLAPRTMAAPTDPVATIELSQPLVRLAWSEGR